MYKIITLSIVSFLLLSLLFIDVPHLIPSRLILTLWPIGHIVVFAFIATLQLQASRKLKHATFVRQFIYLSAGSLFIGISVELIQPFFSRTTQIEDLLFNYIGTLSTLIYRGNYPLKRNFMNTIQVTYSLLLCYLLLPTLLTAYDEYRLRNDFPTIANFYNQTAITRWKADSPLALVETNKLTTENNLLQATFIAQKASRVVLRYFNEDWKVAGYSQIQLRFFNPNETELPLTVIITDKHYDKSSANGKYRFSTRLKLSKDWSTHRINLADIEQKPVARNIDLAQIAGIDFYMYKLKATTHVFVDEIKLLP